MNWHNSIYSSIFENDNFFAYYYRIWIWMQPVVETEATFSIKRDSIYIAIILWGLGGSVLMVLSLSMISILTGEYTVSNH